MSDPAPGTGGSETVNVTSNQPDAAIAVTAHYKTTTSSFPGVTDPSGAGAVRFSIGHPSAGFTVVVDVSAGQATCSTSFTPH